MPRGPQTPQQLPSGAAILDAGWMEGSVRIVDKNIYIIQGEINTVVGAIKRSARWSTHTHLDEDRDPLLHSFSVLKEVLNNITAVTGQTTAEIKWNNCIGSGEENEDNYKYRV